MVEGQRRNLDCVCHSDVQKLYAIMMKLLGNEDSEGLSQTKLAEANLYSHLPQAPNTEKGGVAYVLDSSSGNITEVRVPVDEP